MDGTIKKDLRKGRKKRLPLSAKRKKNRGIALRLHHQQRKASKLSGDKNIVADLNFVENCEQTASEWNVCDRPNATLNAKYSEADTNSLMPLQQDGIITYTELEPTEFPYVNSMDIQHDDVETNIPSQFDESGHSFYTSTPEVNDNVLLHNSELKPVPLDNTISVISSGQLQRISECSFEDPPMHDNEIKEMISEHENTRQSASNSDTGVETVCTEDTLGWQPLSKDVPEIRQKTASIIINEHEELATGEGNVLVSTECSEPQVKPFHLEGVRMVEINYFLEEITKLSNHNSSFGCSLSNLQVIKEIPRGLSPTLILHCNMCNGEFSIDMEEKKNPNQLDMNTRAVSGIISIGGGHSHLDEFCSSVGIPCMSPKTYSKIHSKVCCAWEKAALQEMENAIKEEAALAVERGDVDGNGIPKLTVVADACWSKRSYRSQYNALSGVAAIVGFYTRKVLFMGVRNKFCYVCARATDKTNVPDHACYKNWSGSSSSMEADIIVEGFKQSLEVHSVIYSRLIADGDSSCYAKILEARPYKNVTVEKVECRNHLLRNFCNKLKGVSEQTKIGKSGLRKLIGGKVLKLRRAVTSAIKYRKTEIVSNIEKIANLRTDILNSPNHVFGDHTKCAEYFCSSAQTDEVNKIPDLKQSGLYAEIMRPVNYLANHSRSLIFDVDSNAVEQYNSKVAKFVSGKRINYTMRGSYQGRCAAAVVSHNTKKPHTVLHKSMCNNTSPNIYLKRLEHRRLRERERARHVGKKHRKRHLNFGNKANTGKTGDKDYGRECQKPDMSPQEYEQEKERLLNSLKKTDEERRTIENVTVLQAGSGEWLEQRRKLLTASNFGKVCRRRVSTSCRNLVKNIVYSRDLTNVPAISHGRKNEATALSQLEKEENITIKQCGLFIDEKLNFLGATPDGLVGDDRIIEIKCPLSAAGMEPEKAVFEGKIKYLTCNKEKTLITGANKNHLYFYQIQGQLHITKRSFCTFATWTSEAHKMLSVVIEKDDTFWDEKMEPCLTEFYFQCMLPELVEPRHVRNMEIRDPKCPRNQNTTPK